MIEHVPIEQQLKCSEEPCIPNIQPKHHQHSEVMSPPHQYLDCAVEPAAASSPTERPAMSEQEATPPDMPMESPRKVLTFSEGQPDPNKHEEILGDQSPDPIKEGTTCEHQEGMTTQQVDHYHHYNAIALNYRS